MFPPLVNVDRGSHINILLAVLLVSLANMHLRMRCFAVRTTGIPTTEDLRTISTTYLANNSYQQLCSTSPANNSVETPPDDGSYRLPTSVLPVHYDLEIQPYINYTDPANFTFRGSVSILMRCDNATNKIILHKEILSVDESSVRFQAQTASASGNPNVTCVEEDLGRQFVIVTLDKNMEAGKNYLIGMSFTSPLTNSLVGLHYSRSRRGNHTVYTVVTQMGPGYARRVFPCFDEPAMKATFTVTVVRPDDRISLSNTRIVRSNTTFTESGVKYVKDVYERSPKMSTFQVAFVICDFVRLSKKTKSNVIYSTWAKPDDVNDTRFVLDTAVDAHDFYEEYFDIKYPLPKLDIVAIADTMGAAAATFGLVTVSDIHMFYKKGITTAQIYMFLAVVNVHELIHLWLASLVTPDYWSEAWIQEGFTSYIQYLSVDKLQPSWNMFDEFILHKQYIAFFYDEAANSRPMYVEVEKLVEFTEVYSAIMYSKGPVVARMLSFVIGDSTFVKAFRNFLKRRLYGTFVRQDLYNEMTLQARADGLDFNVTDFMETWVLQGNFPVVTVTQDFRTNELHVTQQRFIQDPSDKDTGKYISPFNYRWDIPLTFASSMHRVFNQTGTDVYWMKRDEPSKTISVRFPLPRCTSCNSWILANVNWYGFYRVNYHIGNWLALCKQLKRRHLAIPTSNRAQIIDDAFRLYGANYIPMEIALTTLEYLHHERHYPPWRVANSEIKTILNKLGTTKLYKPFKEFMRRKLRRPFDYFGLKRRLDDISHRQLQTIIAPIACRLGIRKCLNQAKKMYKDFMRTDGEKLIDPDIKSVVYCYGVATGGKAEWDFALKVYQRTTVQGENTTMMTAMACATSPELLTRYLEYLLVDDSPFPKEHALTVLQQVMQNPKGKNVSWEFYNRNYNALVDKYNKTFHCENAMPGLTKYFNTQEDLDRVMLFWREHCYADIDKAQTKHIQENIEWLDKFEPIIQAWLDRKNIQI
ncbi:hypothetical protein BsWGS_27574 [Bradybaena similaris]